MTLCADDTILQTIQYFQDWLSMTVEAYLYVCAHNCGNFYISAMFSKLMFMHAHHGTYMYAYRTLGICMPIPCISSFLQ